MKLASEQNVERFVLISAVWVAESWNPVSFVLNLFVPNVCHYKALTENYLRTSGLNYSIIRPPFLKGNIDDRHSTGYIIGQDNRKGTITRKTLGSVVLHTLQSKEIPDRVTFDVKGSRGA